MLIVAHALQRIKRIVVIVAVMAVGVDYTIDRAVQVLFSSKSTGPAAVVHKDTWVKFLTEYDEFLKQEEATHHKHDFERIKSEIQLQKDRLRYAATAYEKGMITKEIDFLNQLLQIHVDRESLIPQMRGVYDDMQKFYAGWSSDGDFQQLKMSERASYSYDDLNKLNQRIIDTKNKLTEAKSNIQKYHAEKDRHAKAIEQLNSEIKGKLKSQKNNNNNHAQADLLESDLLDVQNKILVQRKELTQLKFKEAEARYTFAQLQSSIYKTQLDILEREYSRIKPLTVIPEKHVKKAEALLEEKRNQSIAERNQLRQERLEYVVQVQNEIKKKIAELVAQFNVSPSDLEALREWNFQPKTFTQWSIITALDPLLANDALIESYKELVQASIDYKKAELKRESIEVDILKSWYKFMSRKFRAENDKDITSSIKDYEATKQELATQLRTISDSRDAAITSLQRFNKSLESVKNLMESLQERKRVFFSDNEAAFKEAHKALKEVEEYIRQKIDNTARLIEKYQATVTVIDDSLERVSSMLNELTTKGFWKRSEQSIEWYQIRNSIPDLKRFIHGVYITGIEYFTFSHIGQRLGNLIDYIKSPLHILMFLLNLILPIIFYFILYLNLPDLYQFLLEGTTGAGFIVYIRLWIALGIKFVMIHLTGLYIWALIYFLLATYFSHDNYLCLIIELGSIPYLLFIVYEFMAFIMHENRLRNYSIINQSYERHFYVAVSSVLYSLVILYFLRAAISLDNSLTSDLPTILLAMMFIVIQIGLISLIGKKQVITLIPQDTPLWEWVKEHIEKYYYFFLAAVVAIIVFSNPYVGYGRQVLYILSRFFFTLLIIPLFLWIHSRLKRMSSNLFFYYEDGETMRERFSSGRLWYGIFILISFAVFIIGLVFTIGAIWGHGLGISDIIEFLHRELVAVKDELGQETSITIFSLLQIVFAVLIGLFLNYIINQFVLKRVFDPFLVGAGVQNTISAFTKYAILLFAIFIGLSNAGLEGLTTKFAIIIGGLSFALQEPLRDFFSYFIILVQRPVKIGDLIQINDDVIGIVRHITPRSVVLRRRNSVTVIVPNSQIILNPVVNWNYSRSYFAFNDIILTVSYAKDPNRVKEILLGVLHDNYMILKSPAPIVWLYDFVDNGYQFLIRGYLTADKVLDQWEISSQVRLELVKKLRENGIEIAGPSRVIRMHADDNPANANPPKLGQN